MTQRHKRAAARDRLHLTQVKLAFGEDPEHPMRPAVFVGGEGSTVDVRYLGGPSGTVTVADTDRFAQVVARDDLTRYDGEPLLMINTHHGVLGVATGPATAPKQLQILFVAEIEDGSVVRLASAGKRQPEWELFAISGRATGRGSRGRRRRSAAER